MQKKKWYSKTPFRKLVPLVKKRSAAGQVEKEGMKKPGGRSEGRIVEGGWIETAFYRNLLLTRIFFCSDRPAKQNMYINLRSYFFSF